MHLAPALEAGQPWKPEAGPLPEPVVRRPGQAGGNGRLSPLSDSLAGKRSSVLNWQDCEALDPLPPHGPEPSLQCAGPRLSPTSVPGPPDAHAGRQAP